MHATMIVCLAVLCSSLASVSARCDCRTAASCPQAYFSGTPNGCYLNGFRTVGVCCPGNPVSPHGFSLGRGPSGTIGQGSRQFGQSPAGFSNIGRGGNQQSSAPFTGPGRNHGFQRAPGAGGQTGRLSFSPAGISGATNFGGAGNSNNFGQRDVFGPPPQTSSFVGSVPPVGTGITGGTNSGRPSFEHQTYGAPVPPGGKCLPLVLCPPLVASPESLFTNGCPLADGSTGTVCKFPGPQLAAVGGSVAGRSGGFSSSGASVLQPMVSTQSFAEPALVLRASPGALQRAQAVGRRASDATAAIGSQLASAGQEAATDSPTGLFFFNSLSTNQAQQLGMQALQSLETITSLAAPTGVSETSGAFSSPFGTTAQGSQGGQGSQTTTDPTCTPDPPVNCPNSRYRTITGVCNNLRKPELGRSLTGFKRLLPNTFDDGIFTIRTRATLGGKLPSARFISERVLDAFSNELRHHTLSLMQLGQFVDHDFAHALVFRLPSGAGIECCHDDGKVFPTTPRHPQCIPIPIADFDPFYSQFRQRCMSLVRSLPAPAPDCVARPARPLNELTSFLDASNVYGSSEEEAHSLRSFQNGLLLESANRLLPLDLRIDKPCRRDACYRAGDTRVNEQSLLTVIHTVWMREHNRIARELQERHRRWDDERLYQEARRVLVAEWQHILYNEWLPVLIGFQYADDHGLLPLQSGYSRFYDPRIDPTISNAFATAAFRFGHTMVRDMYDTMDANGLITGSFNLSSTFFDPTVVANGVTEHARTMIAMRSERFDTFFAESLHEQLFTTNHIFGLDLLALNIQRGRDHGTPTYAQVVEACNLVPSVRFWSDLHRLMDGDVIDRLRSVYDHVRDVDLFIGGVGERLAPGAQVGPTFQCLIGQQFFDLRYGDRHFYDNGGMPHSFSRPQLDQIRRSSWARVLCDTLGPEFQNDFTRVQPLAILSPDGLNQQISCESLAIPRVDLGVF